MANDFLIVIFPCYESLLFDQVFIVFSTLNKISVVFGSHMSKTSGVKVTPKILKGPWFQSKDLGQS